MKRTATPSNPASSSNSRRHRYSKVLDNRKQPIRGLWRRNGNFLARITTENDVGKKVIKWAKLAAETPAEAVTEMKALHVEKKEGRLRHIGQTPKLADCIATYIASLATSNKREATRDKEEGCLEKWSEKLGHWRLDQLRPYHLTGFLDELKR